MPKLTEAVGAIIQNNLYLEDNQEALRKSFIELHEQATRQHDRIEELEGLLFRADELLREALERINALNEAWFLEMASGDDKWQGDPVVDKIRAYLDEPKMQGANG